MAGSLLAFHADPTIGAANPSQETHDMTATTNEPEGRVTRFAVSETSFYPLSRPGLRSSPRPAQIGEGRHNSRLDNAVGCEPTAGCDVEPCSDFSSDWGACCDGASGLEPCSFERTDGLGCEPTRECVTDPDFPTGGSGLGCEPSCTIFPE